ncbi:hypothetical protein PAXRUDRAFT_142494, partial [Paxillus rubicundulus Ve08.2h10]
CFTPLAGYVANLLEQLMIVCVAQSTSPVTLTTKTQFSGATPCPPCSGLHTLQQIHHPAQHINPWKVWEFLEAAKVISLSGVHLFFWRDWHFADSIIFLTPKILHTLHKFFFNHILKWCKEGLGADELDSCYQSQHKQVGTQHFSNGVLHVKQITGREHQDLQWSIIASIARPVQPDFVHAVQATIDFIYKAQAPMFTNSSITSLVNSLAEFHMHKQAIVNAGLCHGTSGPIDHFEILKLELFHNFTPTICNVGAPIQFTADVSECLLITHCKNPFECMSHQCKTFTQQIVHLLDQEEECVSFTSLTCYLSVVLHSTTLNEEFNEMTDIDPMLMWILCVSPIDHATFSLHDHPIRNHFPKAFVCMHLVQRLFSWSHTQCPCSGARALLGGLPYSHCAQ